MATNFWTTVAFLFLTTQSFLRAIKTTSNNCSHCVNYQNKQTLASAIHTALSRRNLRKSVNKKSVNELSHNASNDTPSALNNSGIIMNYDEGNCSWINLDYSKIIVIIDKADGKVVDSIKSQQSKFSKLFDIHFGPLFTWYQKCPTLFFLVDIVIFPSSAIKILNLWQKTSPPKPISLLLPNDDSKSLISLYRLWSNSASWEQWMWVHQFQSYLIVRYTKDNATFPCFIQPSSHSMIHYGAIANTKVQLMSLISSFPRNHSYSISEYYLEHTSKVFRMLYGSAYQGYILVSRCLESPPLKPLSKKGSTRLPQLHGDMICSSQLIQDIRRILLVANYSGPFHIRYTYNASNFLKLLEFRPYFGTQPSHMVKVFTSVWIPYFAAVTSTAYDSNSSYDNLSTLSTTLSWRHRISAEVMTDITDIIRNEQSLIS